MRYKFITVNMQEYLMRIRLNEEGRNGWHFVKMEPFWQQRKMTAAHGISKFAVCLEKKKDMRTFYKAKFIIGDSNGSSSFRIDDINDRNEHLEDCGFEFIDFHHVIVLHLHPEYNTRRSMKGYLCIWGITLDTFMVDKMIQRIEKVAKIMKKEVDEKKLKLAPSPAKYAEIKEEAKALRKELKVHEERLKNDKNADLDCLSRSSLISDEDMKIVAAANAYEYLEEFIQRVIELDNRELKKQMGKDWDEGLLDVEPDIDAILNAMSYYPDIKDMVEEILWLAQGNLIASSIDR